MFAVDTNILVYAVHAGADEHELCRALVEEWRVDTLPWATTWSVLYEFLRVSTHPKVFSSPLTISQASARRVADSTINGREFDLCSCVFQLPFCFSSL